MAFHQYPDALEELCHGLKIGINVDILLILRARVVIFQIVV